MIRTGRMDVNPAVLMNSDATAGVTMDNRIRRHVRKKMAPGMLAA